MTMTMTIILAQKYRCVVSLAIDVTVNILQSLEIIVSLGCDRVLTSGGEATALEGTMMIRKMIEQTAGRITVVPGSYQYA